MGEVTCDQPRGLFAELLLWIDGESDAVYCGCGDWIVLTPPDKTGVEDLNDFVIGIICSWCNGCWYCCLNDGDCGTGDFGVELLLVCDVLLWYILLPICKFIIIHIFL